MSSYFPQDKEPELPPETCPYINFIQDVLDQIKDKNKSKTIEQQVQLINDTLEYIRDANTSLRECGRYWKKQFQNKGKRNK